MHWHAVCTGVHAEGMHCAPECMPKACTGAPGWGGCFSTHERMPILSDVRVISAILELDSEFQLCMALHLARLRGGRLSRLLEIRAAMLALVPRLSHAATHRRHVWPLVKLCNNQPVSGLTRTHSSSATGGGFSRGLV